MRAAFSIFAPQALWIASAVRPISVAHLAPHKVEDDFGAYQEVGIGHNRRRVAEVRNAIATKVESWVGGNPLHWLDAHGGGDRPGYVGPKGFWPVRLGTDSHPNRITPSLPKDPTVEWVLRKRIWTLGDGYGATVLQEIVAAALAAEAAKMPNRTVLREPYLDGGWVLYEEWSEGCRYRFEQHYVLPEAKKQGIKVWSEEGLRHFLDAAIQRSKAEHRGRAREFFAHVCAAMLREEREAEEARPALEPRKVSLLGEPLWAPVARAEIDAAPVTHHAVRGRPRKY